MGTITISIELEEFCCPVCGVHYYAVDQRLMNKKRTEKDASWYCPNGHSLVFKDDDWKRLHKKLKDAELERDRAIQNNAYLEDEAKYQERRAAAFKGQVTTLKTRARAGVCPCCNRTFQNLARHMKSQHPTFKAEAVEPDLKVVA